MIKQYISNIDADIKMIVTYSIVLMLLLVQYIDPIITDITSALLLYWLIYFLQWLIYKEVVRKELWVLFIAACSYLLNLINISLRLDFAIIVAVMAILVYRLLKIKSRFKIISIVLIVGVSAGIVVNNYMVRQDAFFKDINLERTIKRKLDIGDRELSESDLEKIDELYIVHEVRDISGIEKLPNLKELTIFYKLYDYKPVYGLTNLEKLGLSYVKKSKYISNNKSLKKLEIFSEKYKKLEEVKKFKSIEVFEISNTKLKDLNFLSGLDNLREIELRSCQTKSLKGIENIKNLEKIVIKNSISDDIKDFVFNEKYEFSIYGVDIYVEKVSLNVFILHFKDSNK